MSDDLIAFLKAWHEWATNGAPDEDPFERCDGLCDSVWNFYDRGDLRCAEVRAELLAMFGGAMFGRPAYPFGEPDYHERYNNDNQHECPKRLAWVRERLIEAGELVA